MLEHTGLLPHLNPGVLTADDLRALRPRSASMGMMLETTSERLSQRGGPHFGSPDKLPAARLATLDAAGAERVPFTTGILIGIGETRAERLDALLAIRESHERHGHVQEVIVQNFRAKPGTRGWWTPRSRPSTTISGRSRSRGSCCPDSTRSRATTELTHPRLRGDKHWTVGGWRRGPSLPARRRSLNAEATRGRADAADAMREGAEARANLEREQTRATLRAAIARLTIASRALQQSTDAHRIVGRRCDAGLATAVELLDAATVETQTRLALVGAQFGAIVAVAERLKAVGHDPAVLRALDRDTGVAGSFDKP